MSSRLYSGGTCSRIPEFNQFHCLCKDKSLQGLKDKKEKYSTLKKGNFFVLNKA